MQEVQAGKVTLFGIQNDGTAITITGGVAGYGFILSGTPLSHAFDAESVKNELKFTVNHTATDESMEVDLEFVISGASQDAIAAALNVDAAGTTRDNIYSVFPKPFAQVVLTHFKLSVYNGTWIYEGGAKLEQNAGVPTKYSGMKLRKYADPAQMTILTS